MPIRKPKPKVVSTPSVIVAPIIEPQAAPKDRTRMIHTRLSLRQWRQVADQARDDDTSVQVLVVDALRAHLAKRGTILE